MTQSIGITSKMTMAALQFVAIIAAISFITLHETGTSRSLRIIIDQSNDVWGNEWKLEKNIPSASQIDEGEQTSPKEIQSHNDKTDGTDAETRTPTVLQVHSIHNIDNTTNLSQTPKFLWGITSAYGKEMEARRRAVIRTTYLSFYKSNDHFVRNSNRICSLADVLEKELDINRCQLVYTFVMGGNPNGPEEFVDSSASSQTYLADQSQIANAEKDVTYLNIKENQFGGKMQTWFAYASSLIKEGFAFDYVVKADSDTMLYPEEFFDEVSISLPSSPARIYSGVSVSRKHCGKKKDPHCSRMVGKYYIGGSAEIMSADLAHHVASLSSDRRRELEITTHEDISMGNFVLSHPKKVTKIDLGKPWGYKVRRRRLNVPVLWRHDKKTKQPGKFIVKWSTYQQEIRRATKSHENIMVVPASKTGEILIRSAIKWACTIKNRKSVVEKCTMESFYGKDELYLSRLATDLKLIQDITSHVSLTFEAGYVDRWVEPENSKHVAEAEEEEDEDETDDEDEGEQNENEEEHPSGEKLKAPWKEALLLVVQNPVNEHIREWRNVLLPDNPTEKIPIQSRNQDVLSQVQKTSYTNVYVVRVEHLWKDILSLERHFGNSNEISPSDWPVLSDPAISYETNMTQNRPVSLQMCCQLRHEILAYFELLRLGKNLKTSQELEQELNEVPAICGINALRELEERCIKRY